MMRFILGAVAVLTVIYGGYWFVGQGAVERGAAAAFAEMEARGIEATHEGISTVGFPSRFDTTVTAPRLRDPASGIGWAAPWLQVFALSYRPNAVIALLPDEQTLLLGDRTVAVAAEDIRASASVGLSPALPFDDLTVEAEAVNLTGDAGWQAGLARALVAARRAAVEAPAYDLWFEATDITLPATGAPDLPAVVPVLRLDGTVTLDREIDRNTTAVRPTGLDLRNFVVDLGATGLQAEGVLTFDASGVPEGSVTITLRDWQRAIGIAVAAGIVPPGAAGMAERAAAVMAEGAADLTTALVFEAGQMRLGPLPLGPAPVLFPPM
jgi:hypothetical protein